jgi:hypothetical protein
MVTEVDGRSCIAENARPQFTRRNRCTSSAATNNRAATGHGFTCYLVVVGQSSTTLQVSGTLVTGTGIMARTESDGPKRCRNRHTQRVAG